jgi:hypothetical protein
MMVVVGVVCVCVVGGMVEGGFELGLESCRSEE